MNNRRKFLNQQKLIAEINITPFVDVMLVLLIVFMVTSPMLVSGVDINLPQTSASPISAQEEPLSISIDKKGKIYIMDTEIELENLGPKLEIILGQKKDTNIFVRGDDSVDYGKVMQLVSEINKSGFNKLVLVTKILEKEVIRKK